MTKNDNIDIQLNNFNADGTLDGKKNATMTAAQLSDVLDHAVLLILSRHAGGNTEFTLNELEESLSSYGLV